MATVNDIILGAMQRLSTTDAIETLTADQATLGLRCLNNLLDMWQTERLQSYTVTRSTFTIVSGTQDYTVGVGATVNIPRPVLNNLERVTFQDTSVSPTLEYQLSSLTDDAWSKLPQRAQTAPLPTYYYYNPTYASGFGTLSFFQVPTSSTLQGVVYAATPVPEYAAVTDTVALPPGYRQMMETNLALQLNQFYVERGEVAGLAESALEAKMAVKRANIHPVDLSVDAGAIVQGANTSYYYSINQGP